MTLRERIENRAALQLAIAERNARQTMPSRPDPQSPMVDRAQRDPRYHAVLPATAENVR